MNEPSKFQRLLQLIRPLDDHELAACRDVVDGEIVRRRMSAEVNGGTQMNQSHEAASGEPSQAAWRVLPALGGIIGVVIVQYGMPKRLDLSDPMDSILLLRMILVLFVGALGVFGAAIAKVVVPKWYVAPMLLLYPVVPAAAAAAWVRFYVYLRNRRGITRSDEDEHL